MIHESKPSARSQHVNYSADIAAVDALYRQARRCYSNLSRKLIFDLKAVHRVNELACKAMDAQIHNALTGAGYHRIDRGPWRKARTKLAGSPIPTTEYPIPKIEELIAMCRMHMDEIMDRYESAPGHAKSKTAARTYMRYSKRAQVRLAAAENTLWKVRAIVTRQSKCE